MFHVKQLMTDLKAGVMLSQRESLYSIAKEEKGVNTFLLFFCNSLWATGDGLTGRDRSATLGKPLRIEI